MPQAKFLCPVGLTSLQVQGFVNSVENFDYVKIAVIPCEDGVKDDLTCAPKSEIAKQMINVVTLQA